MDEQENYQKAQAKLNERAKMAFKLLPGHAWNPMRKFPRNNPCPCGSGLKFKKCCLSTMKPAITTSQAQQAEAFLASGATILQAAQDTLGQKGVDYKDVEK